MSLVDRVRACHGFEPREFLEFRVAGQDVGWVLPAFAAKLRPYPEVFEVSDASVELSPRLTAFDTRTAAVHSVLEDMVRTGALWRLRGEAYPVGNSWGKPPFLTIDRAVVPSFGVEAYGIHVNGYVRKRGGLHLWVGRRALDKATAPGKLDHLIAGGHPHGIGLVENLVKEAREEADIPERLARTAVPVGAVGYRLRNQEGLRNDVLFVYDLDVPEDFTPRNTDGEVAEFMLWPIRRVVETLESTDDFKFNVALVAIDFLIRHGIVGPKHPDYVELLAGRFLRDGVEGR